jgi:hypothetical protein
MKVIFLDIDGVLNSEEYASRWHKENLGQKGHHIWVDEEAVDRLIGLIQKSGCYIILSSSWRRYSLPDTIKFLSKYPDLDKIHQYLIGITPWRWQRGCRGDEIKRLMDEWKDMVEQGLVSEKFKDVKIDNYVILDDDADMLDEQKEHFIHVDWTVGLRDSDVEKCLNILGGNH